MSRSNETHMELSIHRCWRIRISRHYPDINNAIAIEFLTEESGMEVLVFGLDSLTTVNLLSLFRDDKTTISHGDKFTTAVKRGEDVTA